MAKQYNRVMLGPSGSLSNECVKGNYIGTGFCNTHDLSNDLVDDWQKFNAVYIPIYMSDNPDKSRVAAGLACGFLWTICKGLRKGDTVLSPNGHGEYLVGEIVGDYYFAPGEELAHRRPVKWNKKTILRSEMSDKLRHSTGSIGTCCDITKYANEIETLLRNSQTRLKLSATPVTAPVKNKGKIEYMERDLHRLLCNYLRNKEQIHARTIFHEHSSHKEKNSEWLHPDIVGASFSAVENPATLSLMKSLDTSQAVTFYSYEMKRVISSDSDLKQAFFQALSNSSWANYGYLVAFDIDDSVNKELKRLSESFGIGVILLQPDPNATEIICQARERTELDYATIDKLNNINPDFKEFIEQVTDLITAPQNHVQLYKDNFEHSCDPIFQNNNEIQKYCADKHIPY